MQNTIATLLTRVPTYPDFAPLSIDMKEDITAFIDQFPPYSDYNFFSMITYDVSAALRVSFMGKNLIVRFEDYITSEPVYSFLGIDNPETVITTLLERARAESVEPYLKLIPEITVQHTSTSFLKDYDVCEDPDNNDYIYSLTKYVSLEGKDYSSHREKINNFRNHHPKVEDRVVSNEDLKNHAQDIFTLWKEHKKLEDKIIEGVEEQAFQRAVSYSEHFNLLNVGLYEEDKLISLTINDLSGTMPTGAFIKADTSYKHILKYNQYCVAKKLLEMGFSEMNCEQDLGIPGLREAKMSWHPTRFLKKYTIKTKS